MVSLSPHLAHKDGFGGLAQCSPKCEGKARRITVQLPLMNDALLVRVQEFDRVFDRNDMVRARLIDHVNDSSQGRRLS